MVPEILTRPSPVRRIPQLALLALCALLGACTNIVPPKPLPQQEQFNSTDTYSRMFDASPVQTCEASRRALLSQGYLITTSTTDLVQGTKSFQPDTENHVQMEIRVVCTAETRDGKVTLGFVTALQDRYALKKSNNSASLGVGALGSVSLPFSSSSDAMIKVGSETITSEAFYDRFFALVQRYLVISTEEAEEAAATPPAVIKPTVKTAPQPDLKVEIKPDIQPDAKSDLDPPPPADKP
ncbi:DUF2242 domain-containing protein [Rhodoferax koreensis]|uniref:DUF2242 domain-containing protein n=1 Tax=Rhodoferax koreensis TaxID=1842727 RepID=UPI0009F9C286|nr:DUF2242 domain-containing protein [Rhodoferax koreense]